LELSIDKRHVPTWREDGWTFHDIAWIFWTILLGSIGITVIAGLLTVDADGSRLSISYILAVSFLYIGAIFAWVLGILWFLVFRRFHLMLSRTWDARPGVVLKKVDGALTQAGVTIEDVSRPKTNEVWYENQVVYALEDGTTVLKVLEPVDLMSRPTGRTVIHLGPLGDTNADLMEALRKALVSELSRRNG
jgi:hypothetical protein